MDLVSLFVMTVCTAAVVIFGVWICMYVGTLGVIAAERKAKEQEEEAKSDKFKSGYRVL